MPNGVGEGVVEMNDLGCRYGSRAELTGGEAAPEGKVMEGGKGGTGGGGGCYLSTALGFVLVLLAVLIAVGVGVVVYFATARELVCKCGGGGGGGGGDSLALAGGLLSSGGPHPGDPREAEGAASSPSLDEEKEALRQCQERARQGAVDVCGHCPGQWVTPTPKPGRPALQRVKDVRLPAALIPVYYDLTLQPFMYSGNKDEFFFKGYVAVVIKCLQATDNVTVHIKMLTIQNDSVTLETVVTSSPARNATSQTSGVSEQAPSILALDEDKEREFLIIRLSRPLRVGATYRLSLNFTGPLKGDLTGLYLSSYVNRQNKTVYLATTQFQPTDARKAFPCFDEPAIKSHFNVTLIRPSHLTSLSNTRIRDSSKTWTEDGVTWVADVYETTPKMSAYLLAFVISDFVSLSGQTSQNVTFRVWTKEETREQARYALDVGVKVLSHFENFFQIPYPLPKQDMIAVPDFEAGAMENWGLITYRETNMLYQPGVSSNEDKQRVAEVVAHELAHQWFGNLVTPSWWDDLWLNEGFASFMEDEGVNHVHPEWRMFEQFFVDDVSGVLSFDGLVTSHPIYMPVAHPDEINEIFDMISYSKGSCVIGMMKHFLGDDTFKTGLTNYLTDRAYDAAFHDDLWNAMTKQAERDGKRINVKAVMDTWTLQMNYPVVTLTQLDETTVEVKQQRFLLNRSEPDPGNFTSPFGYRWDIPVTFSSSAERKYNKTDSDVHWLWRTDSEKTVTVDPGVLPRPSDPQGWILGNLQATGFYRVNYPLPNWLALCNQLMTNHTVIPPVSRAQLINDAWSLARGGYLDMSIALKAMEYLNLEMDYLPWTAASGELGYVDTMLSRSALYGQFQKFVRSKVSEPFRKVGMKNTDATHLESYLRSELAGLACSYDEESCVQNATLLFKEWMDNPQRNPIDAGLKTIVYCTAIRRGGVAEWDFAFEQFKLAGVAAEQSRLLLALACSHEPWILGRYLEMALRSQAIRRQDTLKVIGLIASNPVGNMLAWSYCRAHWETILKEHSGLFSLSRLAGSITASFNTPFQLHELQEFLRIHPDQRSAERAFAQAVEKTKSNIAWMESHYDTLKHWLDSHNL